MYPAPLVVLGFGPDVLGFDSDFFEFGSALNLTFFLSTTFFPLG
jgi:hypothetical protein